VGGLVPYLPYQLQIDDTAEECNAFSIACIDEERFLEATHQRRQL
jgi:hypothetical protein